MPKLPAYSNTGPVDHSILADKSKLKGKSVVITGGANGMGEECVRQFAAAGCFVTIGDLNEERGTQLQAELNKTHGHKTAAFVKCDIRVWGDQVRMFETAIAESPSKSCDVVIANAGLGRSVGDNLWKLDDPNKPPVEPELNIMAVNINGTALTFKLAVHYFRKQPDSDDRDRCFIMTGSMTAFVDSPESSTYAQVILLTNDLQGNFEYTVSKYALRGLMRTARRTTWQQGIRINYVAPPYVRSAIRTAEYEKYLTDNGVEFAEPEDVASAMMKLASDRTINGHSLMVVPRSVTKEGFVDAGQDDSDDKYLKSYQELKLRVIKDHWVE